MKDKILASDRKSFSLELSEGDRNICDGTSLFSPHLGCSAEKGRKTYHKGQERHPIHLCLVDV